VTRDAVADTQVATRPVVEANRIASHAMQIQTRAWLDFSVLAISVSPKDPLLGLSISVYAKVKNHGPMPATDVALVGALRRHGVHHKLPDLVAEIESGQSALRGIPEFVGERVFPGGEGPLQCVATIDRPHLERFKFESGTDTWIPLALRAFYETNGACFHTDRYFRVAGRAYGIGDARRPLDLRLDLPATSFVPVPGGTIA
jgi:hypothetical protein